MILQSLEIKTPDIRSGVLTHYISLTMSYFHTGTRTIIGAEAFHYPVRDGKEWDHLAMVIRLNWLPGRHTTARPILRVESFMIAANRGQTRFNGVAIIAPSKL